MEPSALRQRVKRNSLARMVFGKSKIMTATVRVSAGWLAAKAFLGPHVDPMEQTLVSSLSFR
jgi:hypothetical protein